MPDERELEGLRKWQIVRTKMHVEIVVNKIAMPCVVQVSKT